MNNCFGKKPSQPPPKFGTAYIVMARDRQFPGSVELFIEPRCEVKEESFVLPIAKWPGEVRTPQTPPVEMLGYIEFRRCDATPPESAVFEAVGLHPAGGSAPLPGREL